MCSKKIHGLIQAKSRVAHYITFSLLDLTLLHMLISGKLQTLFKNT